MSTLTEPSVAGAAPPAAADLTPDHLMNIAAGFTASKVLFAAVELDLFSRLAKGPRDLRTLKGELGLHERSARDFLDALVALKVLERDDRGFYSNSPAAARFLDRAQPTCIAGMLEMADARLYKFWDHLSTALRTGELQNEAKGQSDFFAALYQDSARLRQFLSAMTSLSEGSARAIAERFPWTEYKTFADVGTAQGCVPVRVAQAHGHLTGVGYDLPTVAPIFNEYMAKCGVADRVRFAPGDFMTDALPRVDVLVMGHILHDWDLRTKRLLLDKAYAALPKGGALIVYDAMIDDERRTSVPGLMMSLNMLIETTGGFDYTPGDCFDWMRDAGFRDYHVEPAAGIDSMIIAYK
jgi:hypothetical protein